MGPLKWTGHAFWKGWMSLLLFVRCLLESWPVTVSDTGVTSARCRNNPAAFLSTFLTWENFWRVRAQNLSSIFSHSANSNSSPRIQMHAHVTGVQARGRARAHTHSEWICHLIIMRRKILANGEHTEGCNYDPFQRAHALWQRFHPDREKERQRKKSLPRNDGKMCPSLQLRTIILCKKIVSIAFQPRSKTALMGVMVGNGGDSGRRSDIFGWWNCWLRACEGLNHTKGWWEIRSCEVEKKNTCKRIKCVSRW